VLVFALVSLALCVRHSAMGQRVSQNMCCSVRDKNEKCRGGALSAGYSPQFRCLEQELRLDKPTCLAFSPLWFSGAGAVKRVALAGERDVHVYRIIDELISSDMPQIALEHELRLGDSQVVHSLIFGDDSSSRHLIVGIGPPGESEEGHSVRIWNCEVAALVWKVNEGYVETLEGHCGPIHRLVANPTYLFSADATGECRVWQKNKAFCQRAAARLHQGPLADAVMDRLFLYTIGEHDCHISIWTVPELQECTKIDVSFPSHLLAADLGCDAQQMAALAAAPNWLSRLTSLRRPLSRWASSRGSTRDAKFPRGLLFVAGVIGGDSEIANSGVLMEWSLGSEPRCVSAQIAHEQPIAALAYGPYDNGPLVTADASGVFRIWDWGKPIQCVQHVEFSGTCENLPVAMAIEPQKGLFTTVGDKRLFIWRRHQLTELLNEPF